MKLDELREKLRSAARPGDAEFLQGFFKTGPGQYGEGDVFIGVRVPVVRKLAKETDGLKMREVLSLLRSKYHEERLLALIILVRRFEWGTESERKEIFDIYLREKRWINNWDLVDVSAPKIVGAWLLDKPRKILGDLASSSNVWDRRIAVLSSFAFIRKGQFADSLQLCERLLQDKQDLIHKACGWMLRELGKRDRATLIKFLDEHAAHMPRTMLRYAIERLTPAERKRYLKGAACSRQGDSRAL
jgi:3-methyladenine DNA glycosylase AlkD